MDEAKENRLLETIKYYQNGINKHSKLGNDAKILHYIGKLYDMPITVSHLQETGVGRTINSLRKYSGDVGNASRAIVGKWKEMVENEDETENDNDNHASNDSVEHSSNDRRDDSNDGYESEEKPAKKSHDSSHSSRSHHKKKDKRHTHSSHSDDRPEEASENKHRKKSKHDKKRKHKSSESHHSKRRRADSEEASEPEEAPMEEDTDEEKVLERPPTPEPQTRPKKHHKSDKHRESEPKTKQKHSSHKHENGHKKDKPEKSKSSEKSEKKDKVKTPTKAKVTPINEGIDSGSGTSFAEALGMMEPSTSRNNKKKSVTTSPVTKPRVHTPQKSESPTNGLSLLTPNAKLEPLDLNLPEITTNYKPLGLYNYDASQIAHNLKMTEDEALCKVISSKSQRTKVYSGNKSLYNSVPTLFNLCVKVLQENIEFLEYTGGVPYLILKPVLERATPDQLHMAEQYNPYLLEDSDELWEVHCKRHFRAKQREEMESWRDMYMRCLDERESKLKALTANIKQSIDKSVPVRQTKLAYVDSVVKPPRGIARKQAKYGTKNVVSTPMTNKLNSIVSAGSIGIASVPNPGARASTASSSSSSSSSLKPKKAPLMQKTLALLKNRFRR